MSKHLLVRNLNKFQLEIFLEELKTNRNNATLDNCNDINARFKKFYNAFRQLLDKHARKEKKRCAKSW